MSAAALAAREVSAGAVVSGASFALEGGLIGLVGPNGSGKTTLLRALAGVSPHRGEITVAGQRLDDLTPGKRARAIAYLPQIAPVSWPVAVRHLVALGRLAHGGDADTPRGMDAISTALAATGVTHLADRSVDTLSGGERARVLLARALAVEAPVLIADEPIAALDPRHQVETLAHLRAVADSERMVVAALHDLALASRYADRVMVMKQGRIVADGPPGTVLNDAVISDVFGLQTSGSDRFGPVWEPAVDTQG